MASYAKQSFHSYTYPQMKKIFQTFVKLEIPNARGLQLRKYEQLAH